MCSRLTDRRTATLLSPCRDAPMWRRRLQVDLPHSTIHWSTARRCQSGSWLGWQNLTRGQSWVERCCLCSRYANWKVRSFPGWMPDWWRRIWCSADLQLRRNGGSRLDRNSSNFVTSVSHDYSSWVSWWFFSTWSQFFAHTTTNTVVQASHLQIVPYVISVSVC